LGQCRIMNKRFNEQRRRYRETIPGADKATYQKKYDKAMSGRDPKAAIAAKCLDCMHWQRRRIRECPIVCCPLWPYRPFVGDGERITSATGT
jgi:hypothetical protein